MSENSLVIFAKASQMLAEANTIQKAKELKNLALTAKDWAKRKGMGVEAVKLANSYAIEAERKMGQMLKETERAPAGRPKLIGTTVVPINEYPTLKELGLTKKDSARAQKLADLDEEIVEEIKENKKSIAKAIKQKDKEEKSKARKKHQDEVAKTYKTSDDIKIYIGDCLDVTKKEIKKESVDVIITDPPYPFEYLDCWSKLSKIANHALKPSGLCIAMSGQLYLPEVMKRLNEHLAYYWMVGLIGFGPKQIVHPRNAQCGWKPILIYQKEPVKKYSHSFYDLITSTSNKEKDDHKWQQSLNIYETLVKYFSESGDTILEPFAGSGTTLLACKNLKRRCIGIEIDGKNENAIKARLS